MLRSTREEVLSRKEDGRRDICNKKADVKNHRKGNRWNMRRKNITGRGALSPPHRPPPTAPLPRSRSATPLSRTSFSGTLFIDVFQADYCALPILDFTKTTFFFARWGIIMTFLVIVIFIIRLVISVVRNSSLVLFDAGASAFKVLGVGFGEDVADGRKSAEGRGSGNGGAATEGWPGLGLNVDAGGGACC